MMRSKTLLGFMILAALSVCADRPHDLFNAHRERILSEGVVAIEDFVFLVGRAKSLRNSGDAVGWTKAAESAKWELGNRFKQTAPWAFDVSEEEKEAGWLEYRAMHPQRFSIVGMQRIWTCKNSPDGFLVVLAIPAAYVDLSPPTEDDLRQAVAEVRNRRKRQQEAEIKEAIRVKAESEAAKGRAGYREETKNGVRQQQVDEDLIL